MFKSDAPGELNGFLDAGSKMTGQLSFEDTFRVDGSLEGSVSSKGDLVVGDGGEIDGEISVGRLFVSGTVKGVVKAVSRIEITPSGKVEAEIHTPALIIEEGAFFEGACHMRRSGEGDESDSSKNEKSVRRFPASKS